MAAYKKHVKPSLKRIAAVLGAAAVLIGLGATLLILREDTNRRGVLDEGVHFGRAGADSAQRISETDALHSSKQILQEWRRELRKGARTAPHERFANPSPAELRRELENAARVYHFDVVSLTLLRPQQLAPKVVVKTTDYVGLAKATPSILARLDLRARTGDDRTGWRYEGFLFEARDERAVPFLITFNYWRGPDGGGGQWARSDRLFPFPHG